MAKAVVKWLIITNLIVCVNASALAQVPDPGRLAFQLMCMACHGTDGKGNGPLAEQLKVAPTDLTVLARNNNGVFPLSAIYEIIDGRKVVAAHGTRDMPIWGAIIRKPLYPSDKLIDSSDDPDAIMRSRILAIIEHLSRIQER